MPRAPLSRLSMMLPAMLAILLAGPPSAAQTVEPPGTGSVEGYLPGVQPQAPLLSEPTVSCRQIYIDRARDGFMPARGPRYQAVNLCRKDGGPESVSPLLPPSNLRQLRGLPY